MLSPSEISIILHVIRKPNSIIVLLFIEIIPGSLVGQDIIKKKELTMKISMYFLTVAIIFIKCLNTFQS